jgi:predicted GIY-YIG superfamily endonuclease
VLRNPDGKLYIGQTDDLSRRIRQHKDPGSASTGIACRTTAVDPPESLMPVEALE